ncbi:hypothetical protein [Streptomyces sp. NPDC059142]|uniref:hypothetical protein n=1 Tax=Streptomyces sp. NPDC059142 TaxID=3346739 RepID=UPI003675A234
MSYRRFPTQPPASFETLVVEAMALVRMHFPQATQASGTGKRSVIFHMMKPATWSLAPKSWVLFPTTSYRDSVRAINSWLRRDFLRAGDLATSEGPARELTLSLLRTAESTNGRPSITTGLHYGLKTEPLSDSTWIVDGQQRLAPLLKSSRRAGEGRTASQFRLLADGLALQLNRLSRATEASSAESIVRNARALADSLLELTLHILSSFAHYFGHFAAPPPTDASPCGVLRLTVPAIPRAPGVWPFSGPTDFALVA